MEYTIFILALPVLSFLVLALAGMKMPHKVAGAIGTLSLAAVTVLSYITAEKDFCLSLRRGTSDGCRSRSRCTSTWVSCWILSR